MKISEAAKMTGLSDSNIRFYERKGLLAPARKEDSKYRDYSDEDIRRLKEIILYRKLNLPIETIYLLVRGEISAADALKRQEEELVAQREMLQGSIDLCRRMLGEDDLQNIDVDYYLNYVKTEEENGKRFAEIGELLEDIAEFSGLSSFGSWKGYLITDYRLRRGAALALVLFCIAVAVIQIAEGIRGEGAFPQARLTFWIIWLLGFGIAFFRFRFRKGRRG